MSISISFWISQGVESFEKEFSESLGADCYAAGVDNGLNAIHLGVVAAGIGTGDEVIVQANGYIATILAICQCGATSVFIEPNYYYEMDATKIKKSITGKTKAVLVTHLYGLAREMDEIVNICRERELLLSGKIVGFLAKQFFSAFTLLKISAQLVMEGQLHLKIKNTLKR